MNIAVCDDDMRDASKLENTLLKVSTQSENAIILKDKRTIPITVKYRKSLKRSYINYVRWRRIR